MWYTSCVHMATCLLELAGFSAVVILISSLCCGDFKEVAILHVAVFFVIVVEGSCTLQLRAPLPGYHIFYPCLRGSSSSASVLSSLASDVWSPVVHEDLSLRRCYSGRMWWLEPGSHLDPTQTKSMAWICRLDQAALPESQANRPSVPLPSLFARHCYPQPAAWPLPYVLPLYYGTCLYNSPSQLVHALVVTVMVPSQPISSVHGVLLQQIYIVDSKKMSLDSAHSDWLPECITLFGLVRPYLDSLSDNS